MSKVSYHLQNGTLPDKDCLLEKISDEFMLRQMPVMVILGVLGLVGFIGNSFVLVFYSRIPKQTAFTIFIRTLCIADLAICCVSCPMEIVDIRLNYTFESAIVCKFLKHVNYAASLLSCFTLVAIAIYRYRKVYKPFAVEVPQRKARTACAILIGIALVITTPVYGIYTNVKVNVTNEFYDDLEGRDCRVDMENAFVLTVVSGTSVILVFLVAFAILAVLYYKIGRCYYNHRNRKRNILNERPRRSDTCAGDVVLSEIRNDIPVSRGEVGQTSQEEGTQSEDEGRQPELDKETIKSTFLALTITVVFVVSFLPYLIVAILNFVGTKFGDQHSILSNLAARGYVLNNALNPLIYGCFNSNFRNFVGKTFLCCIYK